MAEEKQCRYCGKMFLPDPRVGARQKACSRECAKARKQENNQSFARINPGYWSGRYDELKDWRAKHPEYQRNWRQRRRGRLCSVKPGEIQAEIIAKAIEAFEKNREVFREIQAEFLTHLTDNPGKYSHGPAGAREIQAE
jgi:hypothetical protein